MAVFSVFGPGQLLSLVMDESGLEPGVSFPGTLFAAMLSFTAVFGATLHMQQYSDRFIAPVFLVLSVLFSLLFVVYVWGLAMVFYSQG